MVHPAPGTVRAGAPCSPWNKMATRLENPEQHFLRCVDKSAGPDSCWPWLGGYLSSGYGRTYVKRRSITAHRLAYIYHFKVVLPTTIDVHHKCSNKGCCNPLHLRTVPKDKHFQLEVRNQRIGWPLAKELRAAAVLGVPFKRLARIHGLHPWEVYDVVNLKKWHPEAQL
jgi:hypothetical protein